MPLQSLGERFWHNVDRSGGPDACWPWTGSRLPAGYGRFWFNGRKQSAHRVAYELDRGCAPPSERPQILHHCDNPPCCNAAHLFSGTNADNMADRDVKGRMASGNRHGTQTHPNRIPRGERNGRAKLTELEVCEIRQRCSTGESQTTVARSFRVSQQLVSQIIQREIWINVSG